MTILRSLKRLLDKPPATGLWALFWATVAVALPTTIRGLVNSEITGVAFSPYIPFVLLAALALGWRYAAFVALSCAAVADLLFIDPRFVPLAGPTDAFGISIFLASSALIILLVEAARSISEVRARPVLCEDGRTGIIFSLEKGQAWASWYGSAQQLRLGSQAEVAEMMQDFLAQLELGKRLNGKK